MEFHYTAKKFKFRTKERSSVLTTVLPLFLNIICPFAVTVETSATGEEEREIMSPGGTRDKGQKEDVPLCQNRKDKRV